MKDMYRLAYSIHRAYAFGRMCTFLMAENRKIFADLGMMAAWNAALVSLEENFNAGPPAPEA